MCLLSMATLLTIGAYIFSQTETFRLQKKRYFRSFHGYLGNDEDVSSWMIQNYTGCAGKFVGYGHQFAVLKDVIMKKGERKFYMSCGPSALKDLKYWFQYGSEGTHLDEWRRNIVGISNDEVYSTSCNSRRAIQTDGEGNTQNPLQILCLQNRLVIAVQRYEYANLYHTLTDWYNAFLVSKLLNVPMNKVTILLVGKNISGPLDDVWLTLFHDITYMADINEAILIPKMAWSILGYESPINYVSRRTLPYVNEFKEFVYEQYHLNIKPQTSFDCDKLTIVFLLRRDYMTHPGNIEGKVSRKIKNEDELLDSIQQDYPGANVKGIQFDRYSFKEQLQFIAGTDILIAMHGAGLSHVLFLPAHAGLFEMYPMYKRKSPGNMYFQGMARWRGLRYISWQNVNPNNEFPDMYTYVPPNILKQNVRTLFRQICGKG